jgi:hypothetical protein
MHVCIQVIVCVRACLFIAAVLSCIQVAAYAHIVCLCCVHVCLCLEKA